MRLNIGVDFGGYLVESLLGKGGMGEVYKATELGINRPIALKLLPADLVSDKMSKLRFDHEAKLVGNLEHPNIIPLYRHGIQDDIPWMAMRFVDGGDLSKHLADPSELKLDVLSVLAGVASALDYAHNEGVLHRDVKPQNILVSKGGAAYLADFGIAKLREGDWKFEPNLLLKTVTGLIVGAPAYMSPEQVQGLPLKPATDIYSLAVICFQWLTGSRPFEADAPASVLFKQVFEPVPKEKMKDLAPAVQAVLSRGLSKRSEDRYETATAMIAALGRALGTSAHIPTPPRRRWMVPAIGLGVAAALAGAVIVGKSVGNSAQDKPPVASPPIIQQPTPESPTNADPKPSVLPDSKQSPGAAAEAALTLAEEGKWELAWPALDKAEQALRDRLNEKPNNMPRRMELAVALWKDGYFAYWFARDSIRGIKQLQAAAAVVEEIDPAVDDAERGLIWQVESLLADALRGKGDLGKAKLALAKAWKVSQEEAVVSGLPAGVYRHALHTLRVQGEVSADEKDYKQANKYFGAALEQVDALLKLSPGDSSLINAKLNVLNVLAGVATAQKDYSKALEFSKKGTALGKGLEGPLREAYLVSQQGIGSALRSLGKKSEAIAAYEEATNTADGLPGANGLPLGTNINAVDCRGIMANNAAADRDYKTAVKYYNEAATITHTMLEKRADDMNLRARLAEFLRLSGVYTYEQIGDKDAGLALVRKANEEAKKLDKVDRWVVWNARQDLATMLHKSGEPDEAASLQAEAKDIADRAPGDEGLPVGYGVRSLATYMEIGLAANKARRFGDAHDAFEHARAIALAMVNVRPEDAWLKEQLDRLKTLP